VSAVPVLEVHGLEKSFTLHTQGGVRLPVLHGVSLVVYPGECIALADPSGAGKSTLLRAIYGNYLAERGRILVRHGTTLVDLVGADARTVLAVRRRTVGYVSQFLRVIPRVPALDVVAEPLRALAVPLVLLLDVLLERPRTPEEIDHHRVIDDEMYGDLWIDAARIRSEMPCRVAHRSEIHDGWNAGKVLHQYARRPVCDLTV